MDRKKRDRFRARRKREARQAEIARNGKSVTIKAPAAAAGASGK